VARIWSGSAETPLRLFIGNVVSVEPNDTEMTIKVDGFGNWSAIPAPAYNIDTSCPLTFGSTACGSTSGTPCDQTYGTCSSVNRFAGMLASWIAETPNQQLAQPAPNVAFNPARPF
jgi:hypothetical protein